MNVTVFIGHFGNSFFSPVKFDPCQSVNYSNEANIGIQKSANEFSRFECEKNDNVKGFLIDIRPNLWICMTKKWKRKSPDLHVNSSLSEVCNLYSIFFSAQRESKKNTMKFNWILKHMVQWEKPFHLREIYYSLIASRSFLHISANPPNDQHP